MNGKPLTAMEAAFMKAAKKKGVPLRDLKYPNNSTQPHNAFNLCRGCPSDYHCQSTGSCRSGQKD